MYLTGLRVSNLLLLNVGQLTQLLEKGRTTIQIIKGGPQRHPIVLAYLGLKFFNTHCATQVKLICEGRAANKPAFITGKADDDDSPINEHTFERELNDILKKASAITRKHLRTHSFRATFVTDYLAKGVPIHEVQQMVGHTNLESTLCYNRAQFTIKQLERYVNKRFHKLPNEDDPVDGIFSEDDSDDDSAEDDLDDSPST
jgi:integrase/recombinase XerD